MTTSTTLVEVLEYIAPSGSNPAVSAIDTARVFYDATVDRLAYSVNNGAYQFSVDSSGNLFLGADPADTGRIRLSNADSIAWEASPAGTDVIGIQVNASEQLLLGVAGNLPTATILDVQTGGSYTFRVNNVDEYTLNATQADFSSNNIVLTGSIIQGATPSTTGDFRVKQAWALIGRDSGNANDRNILDWGTTTADVPTLGNASVRVEIRGSSSGTRFYSSSVERVRIAAAIMDVNNGTNANYQIQGNAEVLIGFNIAAAGVRNLAFFNDGSANMQAMDGGVYFLNVVVAPTGNPTGGGYMYSNAGAGTWRGTGGTVTAFGPA